MTKYAVCTEERFLIAVKDHNLTILKEDGLYRHIRLKNPRKNAYWYDIITWPNYLCISGDMGEYVFSRIDDMFEFFRTDKLDINFGYWTGKMKSISRFGSEDGAIEWFSQAGTIKRVKESLGHESYNGRYDNFIEEIEELGEDFDEKEFMNLALDHDISDSYEYLAYEPTFHIIWILYAINWGIAQYDKEIEGK